MHFVIGEWRHSNLKQFLTFFFSVCLSPPLTFNASAVFLSWYPWGCVTAVNLQDLSNKILNLYQYEHVFYAFLFKSARWKFLLRIHMLKSMFQWLKHHIFFLLRIYRKLRIDATSASNCWVNMCLHRSWSLFFLVCSITFQHSLCIDLLNDLLISGSHKSSLKILQSKSSFYGAVCIPAQDVLFCPLGPTYDRIT